MTTILLVDDEKPTLQMLTLYLEACGYEVLAADNEAMGLDLFNLHQPPIVLTDIKMPGKDGLVLLQAIKQARPETEVIVITGHGDRQLEKRALALEASAFFHKPLDTDALDKALKSVEKRIEASKPVKD